MSLPYPAIRSALSAPITDDYGPYSNAVKVMGPPPTEYERSVIRNYQMQKAGIL